MGVVSPIKKHWKTAAVYATKDEPFKMSFGSLTHVGPSK